MARPGPDASAATADASARQEAFDAAFYRLGFLAAAAYVLFGVVADYDANFVLTEWSYVWIPKIFLHGTAFTFSDFGPSLLEYWRFDGNRGRYLSYLAVILNARLRFLLEHYIPPHPSFSFTWILTLVLAPLLLFRLVERLSGKRSTAWACCALYLVSPGFLSGVALMGNLGRPLAHFGIILAMLLASTRARDRAAGRPRGLAWALAATLFLTCFTDETGWFAAAAAAILFAAAVPRDARQAKDALKYFIPFLLFLVVQSIPHPAKPPDIVPFWKDAVFENEGLRFGAFDFVLNFHYALASHFLPQWVLDISGGPRGLWWPAPVFLALFAAVSWLWSRGVAAAQKDYLRRTGLLLLAFLVFHTVVMSKHPVVVHVFHSCFNYGSLTSLFLAMTASVLLTAQRSAFGRRAAKAFFCAWLVAMAVNFRGIDRFWKVTFMQASMQIPKEGRAAVPVPIAQGREDAAGPSFRQVVRAWRARDDAAELARLRLEYPQSAYWLFNELDYIPQTDVYRFSRSRGG